MPQPLKIEKWIQNTEKYQVINVFNKCMDMQQLQKEIGYVTKTTTKLIPLIPNLLKKYNIIYDFEYWLKSRDYINHPRGHRHNYVKWFIKNGKEKLIELLDKSIYQSDIANIIGSAFQSRWKGAAWKTFKKYCLQFIKYDFNKWEKRNKNQRKKNNHESRMKANEAIKEKKYEKKYNLFSFHSEKRKCGSFLRPYLIYCGLEYKCCKCGLNPYGSHPHGPHFSLHVEHIDGNPLNNTFIFDIVKQKKINPNIGQTNLCFLCPNCHQNETNRKTREKTEKIHMSKEDVNILQLNTSI